MKALRRQLPAAAALALTAAVLLLSLLPGVAPEEGDRSFSWHVASVPSTLQNSMHVVLYGALAIAWLWTLGPRWRAPVVATALLALGAALELAQLLVPGRFAGLFDVVLNSAGVTLGVFVYRPLRDRLHSLGF